VMGGLAMWRYPCGDPSPLSYRVVDVSEDRLPDRKRGRQGDAPGLFLERHHRELRGEEAQDVAEQLQLSPAREPHPRKEGEVRHVIAAQEIERVQQHRGRT